MVLFHDADGKPMIYEPGKGYVRIPEPPPPPANPGYTILGGKPEPSVGYSLDYSFNLPSWAKWWLLGLAIAFVSIVAVIAMTRF